MIACASMMWWTTGCTDKNKAVTADTTVTVSIDADTLEVDSLEELISEAPVPKAADELFDDFIFNFAGNRKLQMKRIQFPLSVINEKSFLVIPIQKIINVYKSSMENGKILYASRVLYIDS